MPTLTQRQILARRNVIDFLINVCENSPLADDTEDWVESQNITEFNAADLDEALLDVKVALEAMRSFLS